VNATRVRPLAAAAVLLFVLGVVGALTIDEDEGGTVLTTAAAATTAEGSARLTMEMSFDFGGRRTTMTADGSVDFTGERTQLTMKSTALPGPMEMVSEGATVYLKATLPAFSAQAGGKQWLAYDASAFTQFGGTSLGGGTDPLAILDLLEQRGVASNVRQDGGEQVRGTQTTRYTADLDVAELMKSFERAEIRQMADAVKDAEATMTVWVDAEGVVRRSSMAMRFTLGPTTVASTVTMELFDFGVPVDIAVPPPDQVRRLGDVLQGQP
jgi:hypothetical protein